MYGQFHNELSLRTSKLTTASKNQLVKSDSKKMRVLSFLSLLLITISLSSTSFAGPSTPRLPKGNGNAQGR